MRLGNLMAKLRGRSLAELRERAAQRGAIALERLGVRDAGEPTDAAFRQALVPAWQRRELPDLVSALRGGGRPPTIPALDDLPQTVAAVRALWPERVRDLTRSADDIVAGRFALLGHPPRHYPDPIGWSHDPERGVTAPDVHWSAIDYLDPRVAGDHKLVWELNRHQFLVTLGQAYALTGRETYAARAAQLVCDWLDANPPKRGVNWASSLEVAYRAIAWLWTWRLLGTSSALTAPVALRWLKSMEVSGRHLERFLSTYFSPNTHLTGEALGLLYLGTHLPELAAAPRWRARGWEILLTALPRHVRPDGTYYEQATYYHRYTLDIYLHARLLGQAQELPGVERVDDALTRLAGALAWMARADGSIPLFGDEDGGRLLFLDGRGGDDVRAPLATTAALLANPFLAHAGRDGGDEVAWLLGAAGVAALREVRPAPPAETARAFADGGLFVMRDGWGDDAAVVTIDCGPLGADNGGHAHADTLAFDLSIAGAPVFVDAGTVSYTTSAEERDRMRSSLVHNTVSLDGTSSSRPAGPFRWQTMTPGVLDAWHDTPAGTLFEGHHDGYGALPSPAVHRRLVLAARQGWWLIRDVIESAGSHEGVATFQCAAGLDATVVGRSVQVSDDGRVLATVHAVGAAGGWLVEDGVASRHYGMRDGARRLRFLFPVRGRTAVTFVVLRGNGEGWQVAFDASTGHDVLHLTGASVHDALHFDAREAAVDGVRTDARVAWVRRRSSDGAIESLVTLGGTRLELDGAPVADAAGGAISAVRDRGTWRVAHADPAGVSLRATEP